MNAPTAANTLPERTNIPPRKKIVNRVREGVSRKLRSTQLRYARRKKIEAPMIDCPPLERS
jgi:hypothetical protein